MRTDILTADGIRRHLPDGLPAAITVFDCLPSTNTLLKSMAADGAPHGTVIAAAAQTAGRGRLGRSFFSPTETGLYISILLRPEMPPERAIRITAAAAVAAAEAVEEIAGRAPGIKWVNDLFLDGKKVAGILTEAAFSPAGDRLEYAVLGAGFNVTPPPGGFPPEIAEIAGAILQSPIPDGRARLAASFLTRFFARADEIAGDGADCLAAYRRRCFVPGKRVEVVRGTERYPAVAESIDEEYRLTVKKEDGSREVLSSGEISVKLQKIPRPAGNP